MATQRQNILRRMTSAMKSAKPWLCFTAEAANSTIRLDKVGSPDAVNLETSPDGKTWTAYTWDGNTGVTITLANIGDKLYWRAVSENRTFSSSIDDYYRFVGNTKERSISGNICSLLSKHCVAESYPRFAFMKLFMGMNLNDVSSLCIPSIPMNGYSLMFSFSYNPGNLNGLKLGNIVSQGDNNVYGVIVGSSNIQTFEIGDFIGRKNYGLFKALKDCTQLQKIKVGFKTWDESLRKTEDWVLNVAASGIFECPDELPEIFDSSHIPVGWTVDKPIKHYAQDGLVFQLDCKQGVDTTNYTWTDLKGEKVFSTTAYDMSTMPEPTPSALQTDEYGGAIVGGSTGTSGGTIYSASLQSILNYAASNGYHIEVCTRIQRWSDQGQTADISCIELLSGNAEDSNIGLGMQYIQGVKEVELNKVQFVPCGPDNANQEYILPDNIQLGVLTLSHYSLSQDAYANGQTMQKVSQTSRMGEHPNSTNIYGLIPTPVYSIRIYNRQLTDAERAQNRALDIERFG